MPIKPYDSIFVHHYPLFNGKAGAYMNLDTALAILGISHGATAETVRKNYRKLVSYWHPDRFHADKKRKVHAEGITKDLNWARDYLLEYFSTFPNLNMPITSPIEITIDFSHISDFVKEVLIPDPSESVLFLDVEFIYEFWCSKRATEPLSFSQLIAGLKEIGIFPIHQEGKSFFHSYSLNGFKLDREYEKILSDMDMFEFSEREEAIPEIKEYSEMDNDDDLGEVVF
jgi:hypothetical protein